MWQIQPQMDPSWNHTKGCVWVIFGIILDCPKTLKFDRYPVLLCMIYFDLFCTLSYTDLPYPVAI